MVNVAWSITKKDEAGFLCLYTSITSVLANTNEKITIYLMCDTTLTQKDREELKNLACTEYPQQIVFCDIDYDFEKNNFPMGHSQGTYYRLFIGDFVHDQKVIYLDMDVIVQTDIADLFNIPLDEKALGAVLDAGVYAFRMSRNRKWKRYFSERGLDPNVYFNTGVLLLNTRKWKREDLLKDAKNFYLKFPYCRFSDQDFINHIFCRKVKFLPKKYNYPWESSEKNWETWDGILHYCRKNKPFHHYAGGSDILYWKYFAMTKYGRLGKDLIAYIPGSPLTIVECFKSGMGIGDKKEFLRETAKAVYKIIKDKFSKRI